MSTISHSSVSRMALRIGLWAWAIAFCIFLIGPIVVFIPLSFNGVALFHYPIEHYSLKWYYELFASSDWSRSLLNSLIVGVASSMLATGLGFCAAVGLSRARFPGKNAVMMVLMMPMVVPTIVSAVGLYFAFARVGLDNTYTGLILAHTALGVPMVVITASASLMLFDWTMVRAASSLGAGPIMAFRRVTLPLTMSGIASGAIFAFAISFDDVVAALFLAGPEQRTMPLQMYTRAGDLFDLTIAAAATVMLAVAIGLMLSLQGIRNRERNTLVSTPRAGGNDSR